MSGKFPKVTIGQFGECKPLTDKKEGGLKYRIASKDRKQVTVSILAPKRGPVANHARMKGMLYDNRQVFGVGEAGIEVRGGCIPVYDNDEDEIVGYAQDFRFTLRIV